MKKTTTLLLCSLLWLSTGVFNAFAVPAAKSLLPGDSNCDGEVNVMDVISTVNYIQGLNPQPFCFENADVNTDGSVNAIDVIGTINIILSGGFTCGVSTITDIDGNVYNTVLIGSQCWMKENLKTTQYRNGTPIEYPGADNTAWANDTIGAYAWYDNDIGWKDLYGALYNWHSVNNANGLCPTGWHIPSDAEWSTLVLSIDPDADPNALGSQSEIAGGKMKSTRTTPDPHPRWQSPNVGATNESGFTGFPAGRRSPNGSFLSFGSRSILWSSTEFSPTASWSRTLLLFTGAVNRYEGNKLYGFGVRCLRDNQLIND
jgi:uncharacterized protein (TIGR02145 family)